MTAMRSEFAAAFSALRRVAPRVPFWQLAAHRTPTLWFLYRGLLRAVPHTNVRWRIRTLFQQYRNCTSPLKTRHYLAQGYRWLNAFGRAAQGDPHMKTVLDRYDRMIAAKRERAGWESIFRDELAWIEKMNNRPIVTGAPMRPSLYNKPLPRLKPQPIHISTMIYNRRRVRTLRLEKQDLLMAWRDDLQHEHAFEVRLLRTGAQFEPVFADLPSWMEPIDRLLSDINASYALDDERANTPYSPEFLAMLKEARREKIRNKTRERERERRGEVLGRTLRRMRAGPPAHILARMTPEQQAHDRILRRVGEAGYTGRIKRAAGMRMKHGDAWQRENGAPHEQEELEKQEREFREAQMRKLRGEDPYSEGS